MLTKLLFSSIYYKISFDINGVKNVFFNEKDCIFILGGEKEGKKVKSCKRTLRMLEKLLLEKPR